VFYIHTLCAEFDRGNFVLTSPSSRKMKKKIFIFLKTATWIKTAVSNCVFLMNLAKSEVAIKLQLKFQSLKKKKNMQPRVVIF
jgi:hypothetical protein